MYAGKVYSLILKANVLKIVQMEQQLMDSNAKNVLKQVVKFVLLSHLAPNA